MNETYFGYLWDISYSTELKEDVVMVEYEGSDLYFSVSDLKEMFDALSNSETI